MSVLLNAYVDSKTMESQEGFRRHKIGKIEVATCFGNMLKIEPSAYRWFCKDSPDVATLPADLQKLCMKLTFFARIPKDQLHPREEELRSKTSKAWIIDDLDDGTILTMEALTLEDMAEHYRSIMSETTT